MTDRDSAFQVNVVLLVALVDVLRRQAPGVSSGVELGGRISFLVVVSLLDFDKLAGLIVESEDSHGDKFVGLGVVLVDSLGDDVAFGIASHGLSDDVVPVWFLSCWRVADVLSCGAGAAIAEVVVAAAAMATASLRFCKFFLIVACL